ncbi:hypothetical protein PHLGIDRAFT_102729 [Phlebiopsis gigantea 11061_1 CR5-6]|uniref:ABC transporter domain-containing protein n=1 Tax=Phlebiopsis gigantea (strain 11061_1 CR5-6) TaxID=745531 RepID=A0A0C3PQS6_PHLG1|nr:hypothetical protein PHLGIDRAFT_102729 [Phlebiopsis gigantea 11061_1 CR5-6]
MSGEPLIKLKNVGCSKAPGQPIFSNVSLTVNAGDVIVLQGKSGSGKTTLLKCFAHLNLYEGEIMYRGKTPQSYGIPNFRTRVLYVPQRPSLLPGTPRDFLNTINKFNSRNPNGGMSGWFTFGQNKQNDDRDRSAEANESDAAHAPIKVGKSWGIAEELWDRSWGNLSGGESQRIALAAAVGLGNAEVLLLDEPTSALDASTSESVENYLLDEVREGKGKLKALIWITHSEEQGRRVGTRFLRITAGGLSEGDEQACV